MLYLGSDHRGYKLLQNLQDFLRSNKIPFACLTPHFSKDDDYPKVAEAVARAVLKKKGRGVVICGSGGGVMVAANKIKGIRCGLGFATAQVKNMTSDDGLNILALSADFTKPALARDLVRVFIRAKTSLAERHRRRLQEISALEKGN